MSGVRGIDRKHRVLVRVGAADLGCSLWLGRNDMVFNNKNSSPLQVIYQYTHWLRSWSILQQEYRPLLTVVCARFK